MQDSPSPAQLLQAVAHFLRDDAGPALASAGQGALAYQARVAANMLDMVQRQAALGPAEQAAELARLHQLLGCSAVAAEDGVAAAAPGLAQLNQQLTDAIASGAIAPDHPGLADHLWRNTLAKLAVDQPAYETYRRLLVSSANAAPAAPPTPAPTQDRP